MTLWLSSVSWVSSTINQEGNVYASHMSYFCVLCSMSPSDKSGNFHFQALFCTASKHFCSKVTASVFSAAPAWIDFMSIISAQIRFIKKWKKRKLKKERKGLFNIQHKFIYIPHKLSLIKHFSCVIKRKRNTNSSPSKKINFLSIQILCYHELSL